jgi:hypothetical protein
MPAGGKQRYAGVYPTIEEAVEAYNNAAYYLSRCGRGLCVPLQGPQGMQERYILPADITDPTQYIPPATFTTNDLLAWAEHTFKSATDLQPQGTLPVDATERLAHIRSTLVALLAEVDAIQRAFDPAYAELEREHQKILSYLEGAKGSEHEPSIKQHLENFLNGHPEFRR